MLIIGDKRFLNLEEAVEYLMSQREAGAGFNIKGLYEELEDILSPIEGSIYGIGEGPAYEYYLYEDTTFKPLGNFKGPTGQTGLTGNDGATGEKGKQGNQGIKGNDGPIGAGIGAIDNLDLSTGEADVSYADGIATIHNSGGIIYNGVQNEEIITDFQIPIEGKDGIIIEADSTGKKIEVSIDPLTLAAKQDKLTAGTNITIDEDNVISAGGDVWEDITSLFTASPTEESYVMYKTNLSELIVNIPLRITIELFELSNSSEESNVSGTIQLYVTVTTAVRADLLTNSIYSSTQGSFTGILTIMGDTIVYRYGEVVPAAKCPKILKIERLVV